MATNLSNQANISYTYSSSGRGSATSNTTTTTLVDEYSIAASKISFVDTYRPGMNLAYLIRIKNTGTGTLHSVTATDNLRAENGVATLSFVNGSAVLIIGKEYYAVSPSQSENELMFTLPIPLQAGEVAFIGYLANVSSALDTDVKSITNTAQVTAFKGSIQGEVISVIPSPSSTVTAENYAQVSIIKEVDKSTINSGDTLTYTITLTNVGNEAAQGVILSDALPEGFDVISVQSVTNGVVLTYNLEDYYVDTTTNTLVLPAPPSTYMISVPAQTPSGPGITMIIVSGTVE